MQSGAVQNHDNADNININNNISTDVLSFAFLTGKGNVPRCQELGPDAARLSAPVRRRQTGGRGGVTREQDVDRKGKKKSKEEGERNVSTLGNMSRSHLFPLWYRLVSCCELAEGGRRETERASVLVFASPLSFSALERFFTNNPPPHNPSESEGGGWRETKHASE